MNPAEAVRELNALAGRLDEEARGVVRMTAVQLREIAVGRSQGPLQEADLRRMDHPYARRHGMPKLAPDIINRRTGEFQAGWQAEEVSEGGDELRSGIYNSDPKAAEMEAGLVDSKPIMFRREPHEAAAAEEAPLFEARVDRMLERVIG